jgi:hypothetical protein
VSLEPVLFRSDDVVFGDGLGDVRVDARVVEHVRGEKLRVFKFKPKRGYRRRTGHRQELTRIEVTEIAGPGDKGASKRRAKGAEPAQSRAQPKGAHEAKGAEPAPGAEVAKGAEPAQGAGDAKTADQSKGAEAKSAQEASE